MKIRAAGSEERWKGERHYNGDVLVLYAGCLLVLLMACSTDAGASSFMGTIHISLLPLAGQLYQSSAAAIMGAHIAAVDTVVTRAIGEARERVEKEEEREEKERKGQGSSGVRGSVHFCRPPPFHSTPPQLAPGSRALQIVCSILGFVVVAGK